jgi:hypothetical protein
MLSTVFMLLSAVSFGQTAGQAKEIIPQAQPVAAFLKAVMDGDQEQMKTVFSENMRRQFDSEGWDQAMKTYQTLFRKEFGEYKPEDFSFQFKGGESAGTVLITHRGRALPGLRVIKEGNEWRVDER